MWNQRIFTTEKWHFFSLRLFSFTPNKLSQLSSPIQFRYAMNMLSLSLLDFLLFLNVLALFRIYSYHHFSDSWSLSFVSLLFCTIYLIFFFVHFFFRSFVRSFHSFQCHDYDFFLCQWFISLIRTLCVQKSDGTWEYRLRIPTVHIFLPTIYYTYRYV